MDKYLTRNTAGAKKMSKNGQTVPLWMICQHSLDSLWWFMVGYKHNKRMKEYLKT